MDIALGIIAEDDVALRFAKEALATNQEVRFDENNGPFLNVWFGEQKFFGLIERVSPKDLIQLTCESIYENNNSNNNNSSVSDTNNNDGLRVLQNVLFVLRISSVSHSMLKPRSTKEDSFMNCVNLVVDYASLLQGGMRGEVLGTDDEAEYVRFKK